MNVKIRLFGRSTLIETTVPVSSTQEICESKRAVPSILNPPSIHSGLKWRLYGGWTDLVDLTLPNLHRFQAEPSKFKSAQGLGTAD
jgi:hypothetical protein